jgi:hypothetical protein
MAGVLQWDAASTPGIADQQILQHVAVLPNCVSHIIIRKKPALLLVLLILAGADMFVLEND